MLEIIILMGFALSIFIRIHYFAMVLIMFYYKISIETDVIWKNQPQIFLKSPILLDC